MTSSFPQSFEESNASKKDLIKRWILSKIDHSCLEKGQPLSFTGRTSFYHIELPDFNRWSPAFKARVSTVLVDEDVKEDLERGGLINWCPNAPTMVPLSVPRDGNCLLHSVASAIWGVRDTDLMLRRVLGVVLALDSGGRFYSRWQNYQQAQLSRLGDRSFGFDPEHLSREWAEVAHCVDPDQRGSSTAAPHRFLEAVHVYTLANVLRRPVVVVTDPTLRTFSGLSLQDNDLGGIYLPLEWPPQHTWGTPVVLAYTHCHFSPLLAVRQPRRGLPGAAPPPLLVPLVTRSLQQLPVRFLRPEEGPGVGDLLRKYLNVRETAVQMDGGVQNILCTELETLTLPEELCLVKDYFQACQQLFHQRNTGGLYTGQLNQHHAGLSPEIGGPEARYQPSYPPGSRIQTAGLPQYTEREQLQRMYRNASVPTDPSSSGAWGHSEVWGPPPSFPAPSSSLPQNTSLRPPQGKQCVRPGCHYCGDPALGMMCSQCFKNYTIKESRHMAAHTAVRAPPTAPPPSMPPGDQQPLLSMMTERCHEGCGFRCSVHTYPYCHECAAKLQRRPQQTGDLRTPQTTRTGVTSGWVEQAAAAAGTEPAALSSAQHQEGARGRVVSPLNDLSKTSATPGSRPQPPQVILPANVAPQTIPSRSQTGGENSSGTMSPTQVLETGCLLSPLTPPYEGRDELLFGPGEGATALSGNQPVSAAHVPPVNIPPHQILEQSTQWTTEPPKSSEQPLFSLPSFSEHPQILSPGFAQGQELLAPSSSRGESSPLSALVPGSPGAVSAGVCSKEGCGDKARYKGLCGKCYISKDMRYTNLSNPAVAKLQSIHSTSSSAPASVGHAVGPPSDTLYIKGTEVGSPLQGRNRASSITLPPGSAQQAASNMHFLGSWVNESSRHSGDAEASGRATFPQEQPLGLPENQESEPLSSHDLVVSGLECGSPPQCIGEGCTSTVQAEGALCEQCRDILRIIHQARRSQTSFQGSGALGEQTHIQAGNITSQHITGAANLEQLTSGTLNLGQPGAPNLGQPRAPNLGLPGTPNLGQPGAPNLGQPGAPNLGQPSFETPQHGVQCSAPDCSMYGDPKQAGMCSRHYRQHLARFTTTSVQGPPPPPLVSQFAENQGLGGDRFSMQTASLGNEHERIQHHPVQVADPQTQGAFAPNLGVGSHLASLPPASQLSEGEDLSSLRETYNRVAGRQLVKCLNPNCSNYGNPKNGGICNSCAEDQSLTHLLIYGEEAIG